MYISCRQAIPQQLCPKYENILSSCRMIVQLLNSCCLNYSKDRSWTEYESASSLSILVWIARTAFCFFQKSVDICSRMLIGGRQCKFGLRPIICLDQRVTFLERFLQDFVFTNVFIRPIYHNSYCPRLWLTYTWMLNWHFLRGKQLLTQTLLQGESARKSCP